MLYSRWPVLNAMTNTLGWVLLGAVVGPGMSLFVRNLSPRRALIGGALGGFVAAVGFVMSSAILGEFAGRQIGAALLGFCIGAMVAWVEAAYRRFWLEVTYGPNEIRNVNLGDAPVSIGSNSSVCTVWLPRAAPVDCTFLLRGEALQFTDASGQSTAVGAGFLHKIDKVEVKVRGTADAAPAPLPPPPPASQPRVSPARGLRPPPPTPKPEPIREQAEWAKPKAPAPPPPKPEPIRQEAEWAKPNASNLCPSCATAVPGQVGHRYCIRCDVQF